MQGAQQSRNYFNPEELHYTLLYAGRSAGTQKWTAQLEKGLIVLRLEANFVGIIGQGVRRVQTSKLNPQTMHPVSFMENNGAGGHHFETNFDQQAGLVTVRQNRDEASIALTQDYHDPLSIIQFLRNWPADVSNIRVALVGGNIVVARLADERIETPLGSKLARVFYLRPGMGLIYLEAQAPHRPLKFAQTIGKHVLEALLSRVGTIGAVHAARTERIENNQHISNQPRARQAQPSQTRVGQQSQNTKAPNKFKKPVQSHSPIQNKVVQSTPVETKIEIPGEAPSEGSGRSRRRRFRRRGKSNGQNGSES